MDNSLASEKKNVKVSQAKKISVSEMDILRKAYELLLENSDLFFSELTNAFILERERKESNLLI